MSHDSPPPEPLRSNAPFAGLVGPAGAFCADADSWAPDGAGAGAANAAAPFAAPPAEGETCQQQQQPLPISTPSPTSSSSPGRTSRSPFRLTQKKAPQQAIGGEPPVQPADHQRQRIDPRQDIQQSQQHHEQHGRDAAAGSFPPISAALHAPAEPSSASSTLTNSTVNHRDGQPARRDEPTKPSKPGFFFFSKSSRSSNQQQVPSPSPRSFTDSVVDTMSRGSDNPAYSKHSGSSHDDHSLRKHQPNLPSRSDLSLSSSNPEAESPSSHQSTSTGRRTKPKPFNILGRNRSVRDIETPSPKDSPVGDNSVRIVEPELGQGGPALRTAPVTQERSFRDMMSSAVRNRSEDRSLPRDVRVGGTGSSAASGGGSGSGSGRENKDGHGNKDQSGSRGHQPSSNRENAFFSNLLKSSSNKAADMISKSLFGKGAWGAGAVEKEPVVDDEHYQIKVINLPLVEQTRRTRISKRLEDSKDKTEFWMPAFPWRAIDYLNYKGCDVEGLYRVPGSGQQVKKWQRRFDEKYDIDLFKQDDLYDINIIGSMLKAWLRELPDELFPKEAQERVVRECMGSETVPQVLIDELSNLSPFNYYLLFAITCHLSLLLAHSEKNKMDFRNLCICFQPCMKIDAFCFKFLVCDWRDCWKGCKNEAKYIEEEYMLFDQPPPRGLAEPRKPIQGEKQDDRNVSSSDGSKQSGQTQSSDGLKGRLKKKLPLAESNGGSASASASASTVSTTLTVNDQDTPRASADLRPLSPIKPLSPLNF